MTKKAEEVKELSFEEKLINQVEQLESESKKAEAQFHQIQGALGVTKGLLDEYQKTK